DAQSGDTIDFDPALQVGTIALTSGELVIGVSLVIDGPGVGLAVSGGGAGRVFHITAGVDVTIEGLIITGGAAELGGGGLNEGGGLTLADPQLTDSRAAGGGPGSSARGGGAASVGPGASLTVVSSVIAANFAQGAGGGADGGTGGSAFGGGIFADAGTTLTI